MSTHEPSSPRGPGDLAGTVLSDRYRLEEQIGSGGMGTVWRATDTLLNRPVAVKLLHPAQMAEPTSRERFRTEGRITAGLSHPGIAQVYDYGEQNGRAFLIMELVPGQPLSQLLREHGPLGPDQTLDVLGQAAQALAAAHARGVVHRDIKPGNLLVTAEGKVKLTDFGIARGDTSVTLTQTGMVMGTAQYISPEQASGQPAGFPSDLYALGVVAYECLAGQPPFTGDSPVALALAHTREPPPALPEDVPAEIDSLVAQLLEKNPADRPASASEVAQIAAVLRSNAGTGPLTPAAGFDGLAQTMVGTAVPGMSGMPTGPRTGASTAARRTADDPGAGSRTGASARLTGESAPARRPNLPVVFTAVAAVTLVLAAVLAGFLWGGENSGAENVRDADLREIGSPSAVPEDDDDENDESEDEENLTPAPPADTGGQQNHNPPGSWQQPEETAVPEDRDPTGGPGNEGEGESPPGDNGGGTGDNGGDNGGDDNGGDGDGGGSGDNGGGNNGGGGGGGDDGGGSP